MTDPIGLELDAMGTVGSSVVPSNFTGFTLSLGASVNAGVLTVTQAGSSYISAAVTVGKWYLAECDVLASDNGGTLALFVSGDTGLETITATVGHKKVYIQCLGNSNCGVNTGTGLNATVANFTVKEVTGNHATQTTAGNRPLLAQDGNGRYYASFDGSNDSLALSSVPFQMADDFAIVACVLPFTTAGTADNLFIQTNAAGFTPRIQLFFNGVTGAWNAYFRDDAAAEALITSALDKRTTAAVVTLWKVGNTKYLRINSVQQGVDNTVLGAATFTQAIIGVSPSSGSSIPCGLYDKAIIKGTITDVQLLVLEKAAAQRAGLPI